MLISSASESACSRDGEGDTELDLDMNILPQQGCLRPGPPTPRAGKDAGLRARAGALRAAAGAVEERPRQRRRGAAECGAAALKRAGPERGADGARDAQPAARVRDWGGPGGDSAGREAQHPAGSIPPPLPATAPILVARIGWVGQVSQLEASRERQSVRAPAGRPGSVRPEGPGGSLGPGCGHSTYPPPLLAPISIPGSLSRAAPTSELGTRLLMMGLEFPLQSPTCLWVGESKEQGLGSDNRAWNTNSVLT